MAPASCGCLAAKVAETTRRKLTDGRGGSSERVTAWAVKTVMICDVCFLGPTIPGVDVHGMLLAEQTTHARLAISLAVADLGLSSWLRTSFVAQQFLHRAFH